ncbi:MAG: helix-turn-helix domain-containing protein [Acidobacteriia bacterium]|nr:helix-turn-helix domain-containing protein [Terriglobia bacterium]
MESRKSQAIRDKALTNFEMRRPPLLVSKRDAAALLSLCLRSIDNLIAGRQLPCRRIGKRVLIPYAALVAFVRRDHLNSSESEGSQETGS